MHQVLVRQTQIIVFPPPLSLPHLSLRQLSMSSLCFHIPKEPEKQVVFDWWYGSIFISSTFCAIKLLVDMYVLWICTSCGYVNLVSISLECLTTVRFSSNMFLVCWLKAEAIIEASLKPPRKFSWQEIILLSLRNLKFEGGVVVRTWYKPQSSGVRISILVNMSKFNPTHVLPWPFPAVHALTSLSFVFPSLVHSGI